MSRPHPLRDRDTRQTTSAPHVENDLIATPIMTIKQRTNLAKLACAT
jgi:hypothetical protein